MLYILLSKATIHSLTHFAAFYLFLRVWLFTWEGWLTPPLTVSVYHEILSVCGTVSVCTHLAGGLCSVEAHNSQRSRYPLDYWEWSVPPSPVAHRFSLRWQRTEMGQRHSHANHLRRLQHLLEKKECDICLVVVLMLTHPPSNSIIFCHTRGRRQSRHCRALTISWLSNSWTVLIIH